MAKRCRDTIARLRALVERLQSGKELKETRAKLKKAKDQVRFYRKKRDEALDLAGPEVVKLKAKCLEQLTTIRALEERLMELEEEALANEEEDEGATDAAKEKPEKHTLSTNVNWCMNASQTKSQQAMSSRWLRVLHQSLVSRYPGPPTAQL